MTEFKVGDRVSHVNGDTGIVDRIDIPGVIWVRDGGGVWWDHREAFHLIDRAESGFEQSVNRITSDIAKLLIEKNKAYGDSALNPVRVFSKASRIEQLNVRIDDKISRIQRGTEYGDEDTVRDLIGYLVLRLIAEESE